MKYALVEGIRTEARPGLPGRCPVCEAPTISKCGEVKIWHWAHKTKRTCDHWWENETEWHRRWKNRFPVEWQEVLQIADNGEKHIADIKTDQGWVIEFQHSFSKPEERRSREAFYRKMVWVVDGLRRKNDRKHFTKAVRDHRWIFQEILVATVSPYECRLVEEWATSRAPVFIDFGEELDFGGQWQPSGVWQLIPVDQGGGCYVALIEDQNSLNRLGRFNPLEIAAQLRTYEQKRVRAITAEYTSHQIPNYPFNRGPLTYRQWLARKARTQRRL